MAMKLPFAATLLGMILIINQLGCIYAPYQVNTEYAYVISIDPSSGADTKGCIGGKEACRTLSWAFGSDHRASSTKYLLEKGTHFLNTSTDTFDGSLSTIAFVGNATDSSDVVIHCTVEDTGLAFQGVKNITFSYLTFYNCSALRNSTTRDYHNAMSSSYAPLKFHSFQVGLYFYQCMDVTMLFVNISDSPNATGVVMYDTNGTNHITHSVFQNNIISHPTTSTPSPNGGGGGFYVEFTYCKPGNLQCIVAGEQEVAITGASYQFLNCSFLNNIARDSSSDNGTYLVEFQSDHVAFGRGGGLSIFVKGESYYNIFQIIHCDFENNKATWGGGMLVEFQDFATQNDITISNCSFLNNDCYYTPTSGTDGGGLRLGHCVYHQPKRIGLGNNILVDHCYFSDNKALNGGGMSISVARQNTSMEQLAQITIDDCVFLHNTARLGSAFHVDGFALILIGLVADVKIAKSSFIDNSVDYLVPLDTPESLPYQSGLGAVYVHEVELLFQDDIIFYANKGSALAAVHTKVSFCDCKAKFSKNQGNKGGAIALLGGAYLMINTNTRMTFVNNRAMVFGGAIYNTYISRENMNSYTHCFIRNVNPYLHPDNWGAKFNFQGNVDVCGSRLNSIYSTSLLPCSWAGGVGVNANLSAIFCWNNWTYMDTSGHALDCTSQLSTDVGNITFNTVNGANYVQAFPGRRFNLEVNITDDLGHDVSEQTVFVAVTNTSGSFLDAEGNVFSYVWGESATVWGEDMQNIVLMLDTVEDRVWHMDIVVELMPCPPGFKEIDDTGEGNLEGSQQYCGCAKDYGGVLICDNKNFNAILKNSNWMGRIASQNETGNPYYTSPCPPGYCAASTIYSHYALPNDSESLEQLVCGSYNRQGILCGECIKHFEPAVNSPTYECVNCTDVDVVRNIFKYIAIVYIPIVCIFVVIILFGVRLTSAPANAFILYSQIISSTFNLDADGQIPLGLITGSHKDALLKAYRIPYGIFNLELLEILIPPFCIGAGLDTLAVISLEYAVAFAPLLMIIVAVAIMRIATFIGERCSNNSAERSQIFTASAAFIAKRKRTLSESLLPAFAAFLLLSYTKFSLTSAYIMNQQFVVDEYGNQVPPARVYYSGHFTMDDKKYFIQYFIPAVVFFVMFSILPPLFLLQYPIIAFEWCLTKVNCLWRFYPSTKVHVLLDTFQGCYKIKYRFFAGLYFVFRLVINFNIMLNTSWLQQYIVQQAACVIMVMLLAIFQPYNKENNIFNRIDAFIFTNLAVINVISLYLYEYSQNNPQSNTLPLSAFVFQYILVYLPLIYIIIYILWERTRPCHKVWKRSAKEKTYRVLARWNINTYKRVNSMTQESEVDSTINSNFPVPPLMYQPNINEGFEESEDVILRRAEMENTYRPRGRLVTIVEAHGQEGEASLRHTTTSEDSGLKSVQSSPAYYYGSTGETIRNSERSSSTGSLLHNTDNQDSEAKHHQTRHSSKSNKLSKNTYSDKEDTDRRKTS